jgi:hypothetical protein
MPDCHGAPRPKSSPNVEQRVGQVLTRGLAVRENGRVRAITKREALFAQLVHEGLGSASSIPSPTTFASKLSVGGNLSRDQECSSSGHRHEGRLSAVDRNRQSIRTDQVLRRHNCAQNQPCAIPR